MKYANINNPDSVKQFYTEDDHNHYMLNGNANDAVILIFDRADADGDFRMYHGFTDNRSCLRLPIQSTYDVMIDWIIQAARLGRP